MNWKEVERFSSFPPMEAVVEYRISQNEAREILAIRTDLDRAKELLQELADAVKEDPAYDDLHYKATAFLNRRRRPQPLDTAPSM